MKFFYYVTYSVLRNGEEGYTVIESSRPSFPFSHVMEFLEIQYTSKIILRSWQHIPKREEVREIVSYASPELKPGNKERH